MFVVNRLPTGFTSITDEKHIDFTVTIPDGCTITGGGRFHAHTLLTPDDNFFEDHALSFQTLTLQGCGGDAFTCTFSEHFHFVNGVFQYDRSDASCEPI